MDLSNLFGQKKGRKSTSWEFIALMGAAFLFSYVPLVNIPFTWIMTFFHEISHGLAALLTGGSVQKIQLHLRGSGLCFTIGGVRFIVLQAGYIGAVVWGILIYEMADDVNHKHKNIPALFLAGLIAVSAVLYGRDVVTWIISLVLFGIFVSVIKLRERYLMKMTLKFIGAYVLLDAVRAPLHLIDGRHVGDGAALSNLTGVPEFVWVVLWLAIGVGGIAYLWNSGKRSR